MTFLTVSFAPSIVANEEKNQDRETPLPSLLWGVLLPN